MEIRVDAVPSTIKGIQKKAGTWLVVPRIMDEQSIQDTTRNGLNGQKKEEIFEPDKKKSVLKRSSIVVKKRMNETK